MIIQNTALNLFFLKAIINKKYPLHSLYISAQRKNFKDIL
ncbi:hypothetical protein DSBG_2389 [Desulfosporosinus sp. BG]|nr:hypothetical protein DSBG_2389 [Desulfosporosinus sp. BG]